MTWTKTEARTAKTFSRVDEKDPPDPCRESPPESFRDERGFCVLFGVD